MINYQTGDLLQSQAEALVNTVNITEIGQWQNPSQTHPQCFFNERELNRSATVAKFATAQIEEDPEILR